MEKATKVSKTPNTASKKAFATAEAKAISKETAFASFRLSEAERQIVCLRARGIKLWGVE